MDDKRYFTAPEIDALIPQLEKIFEHIETCKSRAAALAGPAFMSPEPKAACDVAELQMVQSQVEFLLDAVEDDVQHIETLGGFTKDIEAGLVDFLGDFEGHDVWLCWKKGEKNVRYWHPLDAGFAQRRALPVAPKNTLH
jgi:hypothetical protein